MQSLLVRHKFGDDGELAALAVFKSLLAHRLRSETLCLTVGEKGDGGQKGRGKKNKLTRFKAFETPVELSPGDVVQGDQPPRLDRGVKAVGPRRLHGDDWHVRPTHVPQPLDDATEEPSAAHGHQHGAGPPAGAQGRRDLGDHAGVAMPGRRGRRLLPWRRRGKLDTLIAMSASTRAAGDRTGERR